MTLVSKDWRLYRGPVMGTAAALTAVYLIGLFVPAFSAVKMSAALTQDLWHGLANFGMVVTWLAAGLFGAVAFAQERKNGTADFLAMMPTGRFNSVASKFLVAILPLGMIATIQLGVLWLIQNWPGQVPTEFTSSTWEQIHLFYGCTLATFGLAWMLSAMLKSPIAAAIGGIGLTVVLTALIGGIADRMKMSQSGASELIFGAMLGLGILSLIAGTASYLKRTEP